MASKLSLHLSVEGTETFAGSFLFQHLVGSNASGFERGSGEVAIGRRHCDIGFCGIVQNTAVTVVRVPVHRRFPRSISDAVLSHHFVQTASRVVHYGRMPPWTGAHENLRRMEVSSDSHILV
jgi:hypothetical protein